MSQFHFFPNQLANYDAFCYYKEIFKPDECEKIIALAAEWKRSKTGNNLPDDVSLFTEDNPIRRSKNSWFSWSQETDWIYQRLMAFVHDANSVRYGFQLSGFLEDIQITKYEEGDYYGIHQDHGPGAMSNRKLSIVVQLTDPKEYEGGELELVSAGLAPKEQGTIIIFPAFNPHQVLKLTKGTRYSLVAWIKGEPFR